MISPPPKLIVPSKYPVIYIYALPPESIWTLCAESSPAPLEPKDTKNTADTLLAELLVLLEEGADIHGSDCGIVNEGLCAELPASSYAMTSVSYTHLTLPTKRIV